MAVQPVSSTSNFKHAVILEGAATVSLVTFFLL